MWKVGLIGLCFVLLISSDISAAESGLRGKWIGDVDKTIGFSKKHLVMSDLRRKLQECSINNSSLFFSDKKAAFILNDHRCAYGGKSGDIEGHIDNYLYEILFQSDTQIAIRTYREGVSESIRIIHWEDADSFWIDYSDKDDLSRYFYRRDK